MRSLSTFGLLAVGMLSAFSLQPQARAQSAAASRINACSLLPREEIKKHLPWHPLQDKMPVEEERIGAAGSSCEYPSVGIQVLPFSQSTIDAQRKIGSLESIGGIGDEAYFRNNRNEYAELYVKVGSRLLTLQANVTDGKVDAVKPGTLNLARALVAKLR